MDMTGAAARLKAEEAAFDKWVDAIGGFAGQRFSRLRNEALEFGGQDGCMTYLEMARQIDPADR
jgi:hypothetical protein